MIILSVDYGDVRTGIAVCDKLEILASPVCVIQETDAGKLADRIKEISTEHKAEMIIVGLPKNMDSSEGFRAEQCKEFAGLLAEKTGLPVEMQDERLTTVSAHNALNAVNVRGKKRKSVVDAVSAVIILQDYLEKRKNTANRE
ncbi:MAG: Holliday junction resolvase RuvX [Clostridia bacterium]|nr:Holliday junction resolvase RuvX [Clostridia bacterium]